MRMKGVAARDVRQVGSRVVKVTAANFGSVHRELLTQALESGVEIPTDYDKDGEPPSIDVVAVVVVESPWQPPVFSKAAYDSAESLLAYRDEIVHGAMDHEAERLSYTYHDRFEDQIDGVLEELERNKYTRRAQMITWQPSEDLGAEYPPCFQRAQFRVVNDDLEMHTIWRSRDLWKAWASNVFGFAHLHKWFAERVELSIGRYIEFIDSAHIYGRDREKAETAIERPVGDWLWPLGEILDGVEYTRLPEETVGTIKGKE